MYHHYFNMGHGGIRSMSFIFILVGIGISIGWFLGKRYKHREFNLATVFGVVVDKKMVEPQNNAYYDPNYQNRYVYNHISNDLNGYYLLFKTDDGYDIELTMSKHDFDMIAPGDKGKLVFSANKFIAFERA